MASSFADRLGNRDDVSTSFMESMNNTIDLVAARKAGRRAHVPTRVFEVLIVYMTISAGVLGYVLAGARGHIAIAVLLVLLTLSLLLNIGIAEPLRSAQPTFPDTSSFGQARSPLIVHRPRDRRGRRKELRAEPAERAFRVSPNGSAQRVTCKLLASPQRSEMAHGRPIWA